MFRGNFLNLASRLMADGARILGMPWESALIAGTDLTLVQTKSRRSSLERRWRKVLDDTLINLRDHICRLARCVITFQQLHLWFISPRNCLVSRRHSALKVRRAVQKINKHLRSEDLSPV